MGLEKTKINLKQYQTFHIQFTIVCQQKPVTWISINGLNSHSEIIMTHEAKKIKHLEIMHQI